MLLICLSLELPTNTPTSSVPAPASIGVEPSWLLSIQHLALALNRVPSLLDDPTLGLLLIKGALRPVDRRHLNELKIDKLFDNAIHSTLEGALCTYVAKERYKALRREFGANYTDRRLLAKECSRLNARVTKVESIMKETLEFVNKLWADLDEAITSKLGLES